MRQILIVDDYSIIRRGLRSLLRDELGECRITEANSSEEAVSLLPTQPWDLVILDMKMPERNGLYVLQEARRLQLQLNILVFTSYPEKEFAIQAFKLGAKGYILKDKASEELAAAIRRVMSGNKYISPTVGETIINYIGSPKLDPHELLSRRELETFCLIASGKTHREIGESLHVSEKTIATYRNRIATKMNLHSNVDMARYAVLHGLVH